MSMAGDVERRSTNCSFALGGVSGRLVWQRTEGGWGWTVRRGLATKQTALKQKEARDFTSVYSFSQVPYSDYLS